MRHVLIYRGVIVGVVETDGLLKESFDSDIVYDTIFIDESETMEVGDEFKLPPPEKIEIPKHLATKIEVI